jgi:hypothetical protein
MFGFGLVTLLQGLVKNYSGLLATRFFLGVFETGMFPGGMSNSDWQAGSPPLTESQHST